MFVYIRNWISQYVKKIRWMCNKKHYKHWIRFHAYTAMAHRFANEFPELSTRYKTRHFIEFSRKANKEWEQII